MKWITYLLISIVLLILSAVAIDTFLNDSKSPLIQNNPVLLKPSPTPPAAIPFIKYGADTYEYYLRSVNHNETLSLFSNLPTKKLSQELKSEHNCQSLTSAGFYTKEDTHLGLFQTEYEVISKPITSSLLNGFFWKNQTNDFGITRELPDANLNFALQSGPILYEDSEKLPLKIKADENARRIIVLLTQNKELIFLAVTQNNQSFSGPLLSELPEILGEIAQKEDFKITTALNLDGGNHSAFLSESTNLSELSPLGGFFCIK